MTVPYDAVLVLGKELRGHPERARRELRARAAAAAAAVRAGASFVATLEAKLRGQDESGSTLVLNDLLSFGVPRDRIVFGNSTRSTREEAVLGTSLFIERGVRRALVVTGEYHVSRARRLFVEARSPAEVHSPAAMWRFANAAEREAITQGQATPQTLALEARNEGVLSGLERVLSPLPLGIRSMVEIRAGALWRGAADHRSG